MRVAHRAGPEAEDDLELDRCVSAPVYESLESYLRLDGHGQRRMRADIISRK
jgi:hypothetical protein